MATEAAATRICSSCSENLAQSEYSKNQWSKTPTDAKCKYCIAAGGPPPPTTTPPSTAADPIAVMAAGEEPATDAATLDQEESGDSTSTDGSSSGESFDTAEQEDSLLTPSVTSYIGRIDATEEIVTPVAAPVAVDTSDDAAAATDDNGHGHDEVEEQDGNEYSAAPAAIANNDPDPIIPQENFFSTTSTGMIDVISEGKEDEILDEMSESSIGSLVSLDMLNNIVPMSGGDDLSPTSTTPPVVVTTAHVADTSVASTDLASHATTLDQAPVIIADNGFESAEDYRRASRVFNNDEAQNLMTLVQEDSSSVQSSVKTITTTPPSSSSVSNNNNTQEQQLQSSSSSSSLSNNNNLPSYNFQPSITEKSNRILRSYKPSVGQRFRQGAGSLLAFRGGRTASSTSSVGNNDNGGFSSVAGAAARSGGSLESLTSKTISGGVGEQQSYYEGSVSSHKKETRTEVTETDLGEGENGEPTSIMTIGNLLKDTYSFLYIYPACPIPSAPFLYALFLFFFQSLVYALLLSTLIDISNPQNMLHVPPVVTVQMRIAQGCAILIAVFNGVDIMVAMNNLLRTPDAIVVIDSMNGNGSGAGEQTRGLLHQTELSSVHGIAHSRSANGSSGTLAAGIGQQESFPAGLRFKFANVLRLVEGCLALAASFILIVQSDDIIEMFMNFAALEFVVNLDNLAFALAEHGLISDRLQDAAKFVDGLGFCYYSVQNSSDQRRTKKRSRGGSCTNSAGRLAQLKGSYLSHLFQSPMRCMKNHPDRTRRSTLFLMTVTLFGCWGYILTGSPTTDHLCKSLDVEFFHAHLQASTEEEDGIKPFLASRSGTYIAVFGGNDNDDQLTFLDRLSNIFMGGNSNDVLLAYRKADLKVEPSAEPTLAPIARMHAGYVEFVFYDASVKRWIFASCDPKTDFLRERVCAGAQVHSMETDALDLTALSSAAFHILDEDPNAAPMTLPATVTCNECGRQGEGAGGLRPVASSGADGSLTCGLFGGECSPPQEDIGFARQCLCPPGEFGLFCQDHYGTSCPILEILFMEGVDEPPGAGHFEKWEETPFDLLPNRYGLGIGNTPIWERQIGSRGITDRVEWRGGTHWTITRRQKGLRTSHTIAIADGVSAMGGGATTSSSSVGAFYVQPPPAGLVFYLPKSAAWGTQPDITRPFASYQFHCKAEVTQPVAQLAAIP